MAKIALITGASRGIGAATALTLAQAGYSVVVHYNSHAPEADAVVRAIHRANGNALAVQADVADEAQILAMFAAIDAKLGRLDALVNSAGVVDVACRVEDMSLARMQRMFQINVLGSMLCAREAVRRMSRSNGGSGGAIVNLSSIAASLGSPHQYVDYAASKGAIDSFTQGLAREVADQGIRVNAVRPGIIDTTIHASGGQPNRASALANQIPMRRAGSAQEVAHAISWLLSDAASYTTAALLDVCGGR